MRILLTGTLVFILWMVFASWLYVCKIKPNCHSRAEITVSADTLPSPAPAPVAPEIPKPEGFSMYFDYNKDVVKPTPESDKQAELFAEWMGNNAGAQVIITGHTDSKGSDAYNLSLGTARSESTRTYLSGKGIPVQSIVTGSKGEAEPVADNSNEEGRAKNRRAEITLK